MSAHGMNRRLGTHRILGVLAVLGIASACSDVAAPAAREPLTTAVIAPTLAGAAVAIDDVLDRVMPNLPENPATTALGVALQNLLVETSRGRPGPLAASLARAHETLDAYALAVATPNAVDPDIDTITLALTAVDTAMPNSSGSR